MKDLASRISMRHRAAVLGILVAGAAVVAWPVPVLSGHQPRELRVMTSGATTAAHLALAPQFERQSGAPVKTLATSAGLGATSIASRVRRGEGVDIVMLSRAALDELAADGSVLGASITDLARSSVGMAVRAGAPKPDISTVAALRETLLRAQSVAVSPQVSGLHLTTELFPGRGPSLPRLLAVAGRSPRDRGQRPGADRSPMSTAYAPYCNARRGCVLYPRLRPSVRIRL